MLGPMAATLGCVDPGSYRDVSVGTWLGAHAPYFAAFATPLLFASIPQQTVPTSAASLSPGFPRGLRFLGNPASTGYTPDGLLPGGEKPVEVTSFPGAVWR